MRGTAVATLAFLSVTAAAFGGCGDDGDHPGRASSGILDEEAVRSARAAVVRVSIRDCPGQVGEGTGYLAAPGVVVTAAHVADKGLRPLVQLRGVGRSVRTRVTWIDETNDVAVLSARGLRDATLQLTAQVRPGVQGAIIGFPGGGPVLGQPMRSEPVEIIGSARVTLDEEGRRRDRVVTEFRHRRGLRTEGFSGGPLVDSTGRVNGIVSGEFGLGQGRWQPFVAPVQAIARALAQPHRPIRGRTCKRRR